MSERIAERRATAQPPNNPKINGGLQLQIPFLNCLAHIQNDAAYAPK
jgi:hypothetical protein